jgi:hypothetical protein
MGKAVGYFVKMGRAGLSGAVGLDKNTPQLDGSVDCSMWWRYAPDNRSGYVPVKIMSNEESRQRWANMQRELDVKQVWKNHKGIWPLQEAIDTIKREEEKEEEELLLYNNEVHKTGPNKQGGGGAVEEAADGARRGMQGLQQQSNLHLQQRNQRKTKKGKKRKGRQESMTKKKHVPLVETQKTSTNKKREQRGWGGLGPV